LKGAKLQPKWSQPRGIGCREEELASLRKCPGKAKKKSQGLKSMSKEGKPNHEEINEQDTIREVTRKKEKGGGETKKD